MNDTINSKMGMIVDEIIDKIIFYIVLSLIGDLLSAKIISKNISEYKWKILLFTFTFFIIIISVSFSFFAKLNQILSNPGKLIENISAKDFVQVANYEGLPPTLKDYIEPGFLDSGTPNGSPFGGYGLNNTIVTAGFLDSSYTISFGSIHYAIDIVASNRYKDTNQAYKNYNDIVIFATCSGEAKSLIDGNGANYITINCSGGKYWTIYVHNKINFIKPGTPTHVRAGQPIAVMGSTGYSTGPHVHYQIKNLQTGQILNPITFFNYNNEL